MEARFACVVVVCGAASAVLVATTGCAHHRTIPEEFGDPVVVASSSSFQAAMTGELVQRPEPTSGLPPDVATVERGTVRHVPTWYNDPFADHGSDDGKFQVTWEDVAAVPYSIARSDLNFVALPISAIVEAPWRPMYSDGRVGTKAFQDHDANRSPLATAGGANMEDPLIPPGVVPPRTEAVGLAERLPPLPENQAENAAAGIYEPLPPPQTPSNGWGDLNEP